MEKGNMDLAVINTMVDGKELLKFLLKNIN
jgi:hypothetical protein